ncbi:MAG: tetratricopeptide repeat protein [Candidatus Caenarcaniphilales bacterium]|nr:tetratricopeptide repeat protein [Candidatus Caenarcaniphilales bacterium]
MSAHMDKTINKSQAIKKAVELYKENKFVEAEKLCFDVLKTDANYVSAWHALGILHYKAQNYQKAKQHFKKTIELKPNEFSIHNGLGNTYMALREYENAEKCFQNSLKINPNKAETYFNYALLFHETKDTERAIEYYQKSVELNPSYVAAYNNLANIFKDNGLLTEAIENYSLAIKHNPKYAIPYNNLGNAFKNKGDIQSAIEVYKKSIELDSRLFEAHSSLLLCLNYSIQHDGKTIYREHKKWGELHAKNLYKYANHKNSKSLTKKLKIGYLSPDFKGHSVSYFIEPIIANHDLSKVEVFCYSDLFSPDEVTERIKSLVHNWRNIESLSDKAVAQIIQNDEIDILIDLAGHTSRHRLKVFAQKPAPIQVTYIGYPNTTGLEEMDYRITDSIADPYALTDEFYTEKLWRLPKCFLTYRAPTEAKDVLKSPCETNGFVTFGSFMYYLPKLNSAVLNTWKDILIKSTRSKLLLKSKSFFDQQTKVSIKKFFLDNGVDEERLSFIEWTSSKEEHLKLYGQIDISLDTFPYNGTTTICESLWMGVPVMTMAGELHPSRVGASILHNLNMPEFVGINRTDYVQKAVEIAQNREKIIALRENLRSKMESCLCEAKEFTSDLEDTYREMWKHWCLK